MKGEESVEAMNEEWPDTEGGEEGVSPGLLI